MTEDSVASDLPQEAVVLSDVLAAWLHLPTLTICTIAGVKDFLHGGDYMVVAEVLRQSLAVNVLLVVVPYVTCCRPAADEVQLPLSAAKQKQTKILLGWLC